MRKNHFAALQKMANEIQAAREEQQRAQAEADEAIRLFHAQQHSHHSHHSHHPYSSTTLPHSSMSSVTNSPYPMGMMATYSHRRNDEMVQPGYAAVNKKAPKERVLKEEDAALLENTLRKIRVQVNSNQICGIAPSDIDK
jgi:hypothetical protein